MFATTSREELKGIIHAFERKHGPSVPLNSGAPSGQPRRLAKDGTILHNWLGSWCDLPPENDQKAMQNVHQWHVFRFRAAETALKRLMENMRPANENLLYTERGFTWDAAMLGSEPARLANGSPDCDACRERLLFLIKVRRERCNELAAQLRRRNHFLGVEDV